MEYPYIPVFVHDFTHGTMDMSAEEVGGYLLLLLHQWDKGGIPNDDKKLMRIARVKAKALTEIKLKFRLCDDGMLRNERLERERVNVAAKYDKNKQSASNAARARWANRHNAMPDALPNDAVRMPDALPNTYGTDAVRMPDECANDANHNHNHNHNHSVSNDTQGPRPNFWPQTGGHLPQAKPKFEDVLELFSRYHSTEMEARKFYAYYDAVGWIMRGQPIVNVASLAYKWTLNAVDKDVAGGDGVMSESDKRLLQR